MENYRGIGDTEKGFIGRAYDSVKDYSGGLARKVGRAVVATTLIGTSLLSSNVYAADPDKDGLSTTYENTFPFTDPDNPDTDGDGFNDGVEDANRNLGGNPSDFSAPDLNHTFYQLKNQIELMSVDSNHRIMPTLSHDGTTYAYIKTSDYSTGQIYTTPVSNPGVETALLNATIDNFEFQQLAFSPDDSKLYFTDGTGLSRDLFEYVIFSETKTKTNLTDNPNGEYLRNPFVVTYPSSSELSNLDWLFVGTDGESGAGVSELSAYPIVSGSVDFGGLVSVADIEGDLSGKEGYPVLGTDGGNLLFTVLRNGKTRTFIATGLEEILKGNLPGKIISQFDPRVYSADIATGWHQPIGFSPTGGVFCLAYDDSDTFTDSNRDFGTSEFNIYIGKVNSEGFGGFNKIPQVGNQFSGVVSADGTQIVYSSDDDFTSTTNHNLFLANVNTLSRVPFEGIKLTGPFNLVDPSGVELFLSGGTNYTLPGASPNGTITITSQDLASISSTDGVEAVRLFGPTGMTFDSSSLFYHYLDSDVEKLKILEEKLKVYEYNELTGEFDKELTVLNRDLDENWIETAITGFSDFGLRGVEDPLEIYVDPSNPSNVAGTLEDPLNRFKSAVALADPGATIHMEGTSDETGVFDKPLTIVKQGGGGPAIIGAGSRSASPSENESESLLEGFVSR